VNRIPTPSGADGERTLSRRELNRTLLARQMLLERQLLSPAEAIEHLVGMQAQEPQAPYVGLWSRIEGFDPHELSGLIANGEALRGALMRCTVHLVTVRDWARLWPLTRPVRQRNFQGSAFRKQIAGVDVEALLEAGRALLAERPRSRAELGPLLAARWPGFDPVALAHAASLLNPVVQTPPRGLWRQGGQARWAPANGELPGGIEEQAVLDETILRYLAAYGPATVKDIQAWCGLSGLRAHTERLRPQLRSFRDDQGSELLDVPDGILADPGTAAPVRFLAPFDNVQLAHADRSRIIDAGDRDRVYQDRLMRTFLVDGFVAGTWQIEGAVLHLRPLHAIRGSERDAVHEEGMRLLAFVDPECVRPQIRMAAPAAA
jgi:hypothetical protein